ncbi:hypothetical protein BC343_23385 [Mucilaginibacter pedocola]|uniref:Uncharacterized protein n=2 Tax=Mucilaginibacter pedocola TaxID=1792845 RepID=A0A1S9PIZ7_9SPHI|nr:hypothetical protein BC343_23385 [Mucilaginibacter pedocola]
MYYLTPLIYLVVLWFFYKVSKSIAIAIFVDMDNQRNALFVKIELFGGFAAACAIISFVYYSYIDGENGPDMNHVYRAFMLLYISCIVGILHGIKKSHTLTSEEKRGYQEGGGSRY